MCSDVLMYVPLWCKSNYSFLEGASHPEEYVEAWHKVAGEGGHIAITDRDGVYGVVRAFSRAKELGIHVIYGSEISVADGTTIVLLAQTREGYRNLTRLISIGRLRCEKGSSEVTWEEICEHATDLIALWGGPDSAIATQNFLPMAPLLQDAFGPRLYASLVRHRLDEDIAREVRLRGHAQEYGLPLVASTEVLYHEPHRRRLQDVVTCIRHGTTLHAAGDLLRPNHLNCLLEVAEFETLFEDEPEALERTLEVAALCTFSLAEVRYVYPNERLPSGQTSMEWLRELTANGADFRYPNGIPENVQKQLDYELSVIDTLDYPGYFLTMWEVVDFCVTNNILCQGRGSAANSIVCFCLGITAVDPIQMNLLFERFISLERAEPPDIDLDISHERREEVIQWMYQKYGRNHAAMVANMVRYRPRSAIREVGKVLGVPETSLDRIARMLSHRSAPRPEDLINAGLDLDGKTGKLLLELTTEILEFPRHLSIHPGGFLLGHEPVHDLVPIENATMADRTVIQWDKYDVEDLNLFKVDLLGLGALTHIRKSFDLLKNHRGVELTMATLPTDDRATYDMICRAETIGVFQIESRAQMSMLPRLRPQKFYDLVIEVGIVRPGPISGDMVHPYLRRRNGEEPVTYPHPSLKPVLEKTLGIPLFQEQVMKLAVVAADYTPGEADQLRRDMAAWQSKGRIDQHHTRMVERMTAKGIEAEFAERVFAQIQGFGEYGFPESHAASFALITYATAYLRCHHPVEFTCGLLNSQPMGFYTAATIIDDAKRRDVQFLPIDVTISEWDCTQQPIGDHFVIRMGLRYIKGIRDDDWSKIQAAREAKSFVSIRDFVDRTHINRAILHRFAEAGAFDCFGISRREALWEIKAYEEGTLDLPFESNNVRPAFRELDAFETIAWDYQTTFHSPRGHPLSTIRDKIAERGLPSAKELWTKKDRAYVHYAGMVICRQRPQTASGIVFMTLEDETGFVNLVLFPAVYEQYRILAKTQIFMGVSGRVQNQDGTVHLLAEHLWLPNIGFRPEGAPSRDFH